MATNTNTANTVTSTREAKVHDAEIMERLAGGCRDLIGWIEEMKAHAEEGRVDAFRATARVVDEYLRDVADLAEIA